MIDIGTRSRMTPRVDLVHLKTDCNITDTLAGDSIVKGTKRGTRKVTFMSLTGPPKLRLSETFVIPDGSMSLLLIPALTREDIGIICMPDYGILYDLRDNFSI